MEKAKVYYIKEITSENLVKAYQTLGKKLPGKVAVKVHSGEAGNQNYLRAEFLKEIIEYVNGTVVECNTAYGERFGGERDLTEKHMKVIADHKWNQLYPFDLMDAEGPDDILEIPNGKVLKKDIVGKNMKNYDSMLIVSHFKGHPMGGYGGALKQLSIGCASSRGKAYIHSAGRTTNQYLCWLKLPPQDTFLEAMADAASSVVNYFHGNMIFVNVMKNISVDCDCCEVAEDPCMKDIGILISTDPVAIDQACLDLIYQQVDDPGQKHFLERVESRHGVHTIEAASELGFGSREYELIEIK